ncbi:putative deadenylation-dependent decapping of nuclear-transcribed mRNA [Trypoxylus dichotomus]
MALMNMAKLREFTQKGVLEKASTPEPKQKVLKLLQQRSMPVLENTHDCWRMVRGLIQDEKYSNFFNMRRGKMILLRILLLTSVDRLLRKWLSFRG